MFESKINYTILESLIKVIIVLLVTLVLILIFVRLNIVYKEKIKFFITGFDSSFKIGEIRILWKLAKITDVEEPLSLYISVPALNKAISFLIADSKRKGTEKTPKIQNLLSKLYEFRTKLNLNHENKKGIDSTKFLDKGQKLRIILSGKGVFSSEIVNSGYDLIISLPLQKKEITVLSEEWISKKISVYLWRKNDAGYVFDSEVLNAGIFNGRPVLYLKQTNELLRTQKRKSIRSECNIMASMYFLTKEVVDFNAIETEGGYKVLIEDISEDGAMIRVGGRGIVNTQIKLQFTLNENLILMYGIIRAVEYNKNMNQSRLHFECLHIEKEMKNTVLSYVYNVLPQTEKEIFDALSQTEEDKNDEEKKDFNEKEILQNDEKDNNENEKTENIIDNEENVQETEENSYKTDNFDISLLDVED